MNNAEANKTFVERLRRCPKLECNFLSRLNRNADFDGDMSDITFVQADVRGNGSYSLLFLAAKRFENNLFESPQLSNDITTELYEEDRLIPCFSDLGTPRSSTRNGVEDTKSKYNFPSSKDVRAEEPPPQTPYYGHQKYDRIPNLDFINENDSSFCSSSSGVISTGGNEPKEKEELHEKMVDASMSLSSFITLSKSITSSYRALSLTDTPPQTKASIRESNNNTEFIDVKTAKSLNLVVDEYPESSFFSLLESLQSNRVIERIIVFRNPAINEERRTRSREDMDNLFYIINSLQSLVELDLWNFHSEDLPSLRLGFADQSSIGYLQLHMEFGTLDQQLVESIASMISLVSLELEVNESFPVWVLLRSKSLTVLGVVSTRFGFASDDILRLASSLRTNSVLKVLDLEPRIPGWCVGSVMASLRLSHSTKLETFQFSCQNDNGDQSDTCMAEVVKTIESETCLRVLWNHSCESFFVSDEVRSKAMSALSRNQSLQQFRVFVEREE